MATSIWNNSEPSLEDVLTDPIVRALMRRDGLSEAQMLALVRERGARGLPLHGPGSLPAFVSTSSF